MIWNPTPYYVATCAGLRPSDAQAALLKSFAGEPLTRDEGRAWRQLTHTLFTSPRPGGYEELFVEGGRQAGKDTHLGAPIVVACTLQDPARWSLAPGATAKAVLVGAKLAHCNTLLDACDGIYGALGVPHRKTELRIELPGRRAEVQAWTADEQLRSMTACCVVFTEPQLLPFTEGSDGYDVETYASARPMLATTGGPFVSIGNAWAQRGVHYETVHKHLGKTKGRILTAQASTWLLYPGVSEKRTHELEPDPKRWAREYAAIASQGESNAFDSRDVTRAITTGVTERPPMAGVSYGAVGDLAFRADGAVCGIGHLEHVKNPGGPPKARLVLDCLRIRRAKPGQVLDPEALIEEWSAALRRYHVRRLWLDSHGFDLAAARFRQRGIKCELLPMHLSAQAARFDALGGRLRASTISLLDNDLLKRELSELRFEVRSGGVVRYEAPRRAGASDDCCDVMAALCTEATRGLPAGGGDIRSETSVHFEAGGGVDLQTHWSERVGNAWVPCGPPVGTEEWRELRREQKAQGIRIPNEPDPDDFT